MALEVEAGATEQHIHSPMLNDDDAEIERLLSEKLLEGYTLMERICPSCATPLVKNKNNHAKEESKQKSNKHKVLSQMFPIAKRRCLGSSFPLFLPFLC